MTPAPGIQLALVRHAKSDWGDPDIDDHDRPLNERGERDAPRMARQLVETGFWPEAVISSTALRARTTAEVFAHALDAPLRLEERLYAASATTLLTVAAESGLQRVTLVAHDPGLTVLAARLSRDRIDRMPTCAVALFTWAETSWDVVDAVDPVSFSFDAPR